MPPNQKMLYNSGPQIKCVRQTALVKMEMHQRKQYLIPDSRFLSNARRSEEGIFGAWIIKAPNALTLKLNLTNKRQAVFQDLQLYLERPLRGTPVTLKQHPALLRGKGSSSKRKSFSTSLRKDGIERQWPILQDCFCEEIQTRCTPSFLAHKRNWMVMYNGQRSARSQCLRFVNLLNGWAEHFKVQDSLEKQITMQRTNC